MTLDVADRPAADQCQPSVETSCKLPQQRAKTWRDADRIRRFRQLDERPVEIEKKRRPVEERKRRTGKDHPAALASGSRKLKVRASEIVAGIGAPDMRFHHMTAPTAHFELAPIP